MPQPFPFPISVGTDICHVHRIFNVLGRGEAPEQAVRFCKKLFTTKELNLHADRIQRELHLRLTPKSDYTSQHLLRHIQNRKDQLYPSRNFPRSRVSRSCNPSADEPFKAQDSHVLNILFDMYHQLRLDEQISMRSQFRAAQFVAGRWAAKEAIIKAHRSRRLTFQDIQILPPENSPPINSGSQGQVAVVISRSGSWEHGQIVPISISHDGAYATATCMAYEPSPGAVFETARDVRKALPMIDDIEEEMHEAIEKIDEDWGSDDASDTRDMAAGSPKEEKKVLAEKLLGRLRNSIELLHWKQKHIIKHVYWNIYPSAGNRGLPEIPSSRLRIQRFIQKPTHVQILSENLPLLQEIISTTRSTAHTASKILQHLSAKVIQTAQFILPVIPKSELDGFSQHEKMIRQTIKRAKTLGAGTRQVEGNYKVSRLVRHIPENWTTEDFLLPWKNMTNGPEAKIIRTSVNTDELVSGILIFNDNLGAKYNMHLLTSSLPKKPGYSVFKKSGPQRRELTEEEKTAILWMGFQKSPWYLEAADQWLENKVLPTREKSRPSSVNEDSSLNEGTTLEDDGPGPILEENSPNNAKGDAGAIEEPDVVEVVKHGAITTDEAEPRNLEEAEEPKNRR